MSQCWCNRSRPAFYTKMRAENNIALRRIPRWLVYLPYSRPAGKCNSSFKQPCKENGIPQQSSSTMFDGTHSTISDHWPWIFAIFDCFSPPFILINLKPFYTKVAFIAIVPKGWKPENVTRYFDYYGSPFSTFRLSLCLSATAHSYSSLLTYHCIFMAKYMTRTIPTLSKTEVTIYLTLDNTALLLVDN